MDIISLQRAFGFAGTEIKPLYGGTANKNFLVEGESGICVLRRKNPKYSLPEWMQFEADFLYHLDKEGIPVPVPVKTCDGNLWVRSENEVYQVYTYIEGRPFDGSLQQIEAAGELLGDYHNAAYKFDSHGRKQLERYDNPERMLEFFDGFLSEKNDLTSPEELEIIIGLRKKAFLIGQNMTDQVYMELPRLIIHGDYHPANLLYKDAKASGLFDFDWSSLQPRIRDVADGILFFACDREHEIDAGDIYSLNQACWLNMDKFDAFFNSYLQKSEKLAITEAEAEFLPEFLKARLINCRVQGAAKVPDSKKALLLTNGIEKSLNWVSEKQDIIKNKLTSKLEGK